MSATDPDPPQATPPVTDRDRAMARVCLACPVCRHGRKKQRGFLFGFVKCVEAKVCPFCQAYERVYGRKPHEPIL